MKITMMNQMMNMKNGKITFLISSFILGVSIARNKSMNSLKPKKKDPTVYQYKNRLKEFYDSDILINIEQEFLSLVEFGLSPTSAFDAVIEFGEIN